MSHFAEISGSDNTVVRTIVAEQDFINSGAVGDSFNWVQASYNGNFRAIFPSIGDVYDKERDIFRQKQPYPSWTYNETGSFATQWTAPVDPPPIEEWEGTLYGWSEEDQEWIEGYGIEV
jgi:hypothetical protein|tara:strand:- start:55 stop:411 length:357 start_codon:yes stop_codon:yes gene_type:complete